MKLSSIVTEVNEKSGLIQISIALYSCDGRKYYLDKYLNRDDLKSVLDIVWESTGEVLKREIEKYEYNRQHSTEPEPPCSDAG